jgi:hypothetical protein
MNHRYQHVLCTDTFLQSGKGKRLVTDEGEGILKNPLTIVVVGILLIAAIAGAGALSKPSETASKVYWLDASDASGGAEIEQILDDGSSIYTVATGVSGAYQGRIVLDKWTDDGKVAASRILNPPNGTLEGVKALAYGDDIYVLGSYVSPEGKTLIALKCDAKNMTYTKWSKYFDLGWGKNFGLALAAYNGKVYVAGSAANEYGSRSTLLIAFDAGTGNTLWFSDTQGAGEGNQFYSLAVDASGLYVAGYGHTSSGGYVMQIISLNATLGTLQWEKDYEDIVQGSESVCPAVVKVEAGKVFASGYLYLRNGTSWAINCGLNAADGALLWESFDYQGGSLGTDSRMSSGNLLVSGLWHGKFYAGSFLTASGKNNWLDQVTITGEANFLTAMDLENQRLVVAFFDQSVNDTGDYSWKMMVRAYDQSNGKIWQTEMKSGSGATSDGVCLNVLSGSIYASTGLGAPAIIDGAAAEDTNTVVTMDGYCMKVNGQNFTMKGVDYAPSPINVVTSSYPWGDYFQDGWQSIWARDLPKIQEMNANTLKLYGMTAFRWDDPSHKVILHKAFYDTLKSYGLYVIPMVWFDVDYMLNHYDPSNWDGTPVALAWKWVAAEAKDYSSVLGFCINNEQNPGWLADNKTYWIDHTYDLVCHVKDLAPNKFTMIALQDDNEPNVGTKEIKNWNYQMPRLDAWGLCLYRGLISQKIGFTDAFQRYATLTANATKPLIVAEFGCPASYHDPNTAGGEAKLLPSNANATGEYIRICWSGSDTFHDDIVSNLAYNESGVYKVCVGGIVFEWTDEWCKGDGNPSVHTGSPATGDNFPGKWWDEKWFGLCGVETTGRSHTGPFDPTVNQPDTLLIRDAYYVVKTMWAP